MLRPPLTDKTYYGPDGVRKWISDLTDAFGPGVRHQLDEIVADGEDFVVSVVRLTGLGSRSGAPLVLRSASVIRFENGKMARAAAYMNRHEALKAVGLEE